MAMPSPAAWTVREVERDRRWTYRLSDEESAALLDAVRAAGDPDGRPLLDWVRDHDAAAGELADRLAEARAATDAALAAQRERLFSQEQALADRLGEATRTLTEAVTTALSAQNTRLAQQERALAEALSGVAEVLPEETATSAAREVAGLLRRLGHGGSAADGDTAPVGVRLTDAPAPTAAGAHDTERAHSLLEAASKAELAPDELADLRRTVRDYREHREQRLNQVRAALAELGADARPRQIVEFVYTDVDPKLWGPAEASVRAQLAYLDRLG